MTIKKLLSLLLAMVLVLSLVPAVSAAENTNVDIGGSVGDREPIDETIEWIEIGTAEQWGEWFGGKNNSKLMTTYGGSTAYVKLTADVEYTTTALTTIGYTTPVKMDLVLDLGGNTLTINATTYKSRVFGVYAGSTFTIKNGTIINNVQVSTQHGGLALISEGHLVVEDVIIDDRNTSAFACYGKIFQISTAKCSGSLKNVTITSDTTNSKCTYKSDGKLQYGAGGLIATTGDLTIENCNFTASNTTNIAESKNRVYYGGILSVHAGTTTITGTTFNGGVANFGGAIGVCASSATVNVTDSAFIGGNATNGGALGAEYGTINAKNCTITDSTATYGGAVISSGVGIVNLENCDITNTSATGRGGAIYAYAGTVEKSMSIVNTDIANTSAPTGGAITVWGRGNIEVIGGSITGCKSTNGNGAALFINNNGWTSAGPAATLDGVTITDCESVYNGGAIYASNTSKTANNVLTVYDNYSLTIRNCLISSNKVTKEGEFGGNIYLAGCDQWDADGNVTARSNTVIENTIIENGTAVSWGGNIGIAGYANVTITDSTIRGGSVSHESNCGGGNIYMGNANCDVTLNNTTVSGGSATIYGGNIRIGGGTMIMNGGLIENGTAGKNGNEITVNNNPAAIFVMVDGTIRSADAEKALNNNGAGQIKLLNGTASGFDATAYTVYGESYAVANEDGTYTVKHYAVDGATTKEGTCETAGTLTIVCPDCEHTYVYENHEGHAIVIDKAVAPTCTETGLTEGQHCALCDYAVAQETVPAAGHKEVETKENEVAATCTTDGSYEKVVKCENCGIEISRETMTVPAGHTEKVVEGKAPTCTEDGLTDGKVCEICGETLAAQEPIPAAHTWDAGVYTDPTTEADGYTTFTCTVCGETRTETDEGSKLPEIIPAAITKQPEAVTAESGETVQFHVEAQGEVVSYKWEYRKISKWYNTSMTGYNTDTLTVAVTGARNGYDYRCIITFADGTVLTSEYGELTAITYITGVQNPNDQIVVNGFKGQFTASAEGEGLKYRWYFQRPEGTIWSETAMEGCEKPTVYIESTAARNGYKYKCRITDVTGNVVYTEVATMHVLSFKAHPQGPFAATGSNAIFTVETSVTDGFTYQWQYRRNANAEWTNTTMTGYNTATLTVGATLARNGYEYRCVLTGSKSSKIESRPAALHVGNAVVINAQTGSQTVAAADNAVFTVDATNVYSYQWMYSKTSGNVWAKTSAEGNQTATLTVAAKGKNGYWYRCDMKGLDGNMYYTDVAVLTVQ